MSSERKSSAIAKPSKSISTDVDLAGKEIIEGFKAIEEAWKKAEAVLLRAHCPSDVKIKVDYGALGHEDHIYGEFVTYLGYLKLRNGWRICLIEEELDYRDPSEEWRTQLTPITEAPVEKRVEMMDHFDKLAEEVVKVARSMAPNLKKKAAEFEAKLILMEL
jgi:hypothetical protein